MISDNEWHMQALAHSLEIDSAEAKRTNAKLNDELSWQRNYNSSL